MGAKHGKLSTTLAVAAMAHVVKFSRTELNLLFKKQFANTVKANGMVTKDDFMAGIEAVGIGAADVEVLKRIFTLCDETGDEEVDAKKFMASVGLLTQGEIVDKLEYSFHFFDDGDKDKISKACMMTALTQMNHCVEWFGDLPLNFTEIETIVDKLFVTETEVTIAAKAKELVKLPVFTTYLDRATAMADDNE